MYLLADGAGPAPSPRLGSILGTNLTQQGTQYCNPHGTPGPYVAEGATLKDEVITLATDWPRALDRFEAGRVLPRYLGKDYCKLFAVVRRDECRQFNARVSNIDYEWYLRSV